MLSVSALKRPLGANALTLLVAGLLASLYSQSFWRHILEAGTPDGARGLLYLFSTAALMLGINALLLSLLAWRGVQKPALALLLVLAAGAAFFMDSLGAVIDRHALQSVLETDLREGSEWLSWRMLGYVGLLGVLPALVVLRLPVHYRPWPRELLGRAGFLLLMPVLVAVAVLPSSRELASLVRNHRELRHLAVPLNLYNSVLGYFKHAGPALPATVAALGSDAHAGTRAPARAPLLLVLVVGESARASSFSLNGYARDTNPELAMLPVTSFHRVSSCGTNTATSLPCMFSNLGRAHYDEAVAKGRENLLDVLAHAGFAVEWEDNNTGSKGIAKRLKEESMAALAAAGTCNEDGCYDGVLVSHLREELDRSATDKVFVLHQLGSHGPAYHLRYPPEFERFKPTCTSNDLQDCSPEQIRNSYDNTIAYTDHVLAELIRELQRQEGKRTAALLYISDHGESTGEHGLYLHGAPYMLAPEEQTRVPMVFWASKQFQQWRGLDGHCVRSRRERPISHDNLFHTVLGLLDVQTGVYRNKLDALGACAPP